MLFNTWPFFVFFVLVFSAYALLPHRAQNYLLLAASYVFYSFWDWRFTGLLLISTIADFAIGNALGKADGARKKNLVRLSVFLNLTFLGIFKYFNFFIGSAGALLGRLGFHPSLPTLNVILPVGISFYTFMSLSYTIDISRGDSKPARSFLDYALFVAYFPHLVAGPIVRDTVLLPQLQTPRKITAAGVQSGLLLVLIGLTRKITADYLADDVTLAFTAPRSQTSLTLLVAVFMFALQIYGDFAGYTDIARGLSRMMGIELVRNFEHPYFAPNITAFWRRWHMSLSSWLRDYLYIPLGGNRGPKWHAYRNLMLTMLLGGLWHGASWNFVIWGGLHGLALSVHKWFLGERKPALEIKRFSVPAVGAWAFTMAWVCLAWIFFRAPTFDSAMSIVLRIAHVHGAPTGAFVKHAFVATVVFLAIDIPQTRNKNETAWLAWPWPVRGMLYATLVITALLLHPSADVPFIYFQF
jgi:D-alanyl-lipoteichoic acid acyltransferase DltB (MBOAT superfamily)